MNRLLWIAVLALGALGIAEARLAPAPLRGAENANPDSWAGEWFMEGDADKPCAIFRHGKVLLVVNEHGSIASARVMGATSITILKGDGWQSELKADLKNGGKTIEWDNDTKWTLR